RERRDRLENLDERVDRRVERAAGSAEDAERHGDQRREQKAGENRLQTGEDLIDVGGLARVPAHHGGRGRILGQAFGITLALALVENRGLGAFGLVVAPEGLGLLPDRGRAWNLS